MWNRSNEAGKRSEGREQEWIKYQEHINYYIFRYYFPLFILYLSKMMFYRRNWGQLKMQLIVLILFVFPNTQDQKMKLEQQQQQKLKPHLIEKLFIVLPN